MKTNKYTAKRNVADKVMVEVAVENGTWAEEVYLDGTPAGTKTHIISSTQIILRDQTGKTIATADDITPMSFAKIRYPKQYQDAIKAGCVAMINNAWIKANVLEAVESAIAEAQAGAPKTDEQIKIENAAIIAEKKHDEWYYSPEEVSYRKFVARMESPDSDL